MYYTVKKHSRHLVTLEKCRKLSPAFRAFYLSLVFSNAGLVLSQCNTRLRLLYFLSKPFSYISYITCIHVFFVISADIKVKEQSVENLMKLVRQSFAMRKQLNVFSSICIIFFNIITG